MKKRGKRILSLLLTVLLSAASLPVFAAAAPSFSQIVNAATYIIIYNEGEYTTVVRNDNGALSIGMIGWHATNALNLLKDIVAENPSQALNILGSSLYNEIITSSYWETRIPTQAEASAISVLLGTAESRKVQDRTAYNYIAGYVQHGQSLGISEPQALVFFADYENQNGRNGAASFYRQVVGAYGTVNLGTLYACSSQNARRTRTYNFCASIDWSRFSDGPTPGSDTTAPEIKDVVVSDLNSSGYTVSCSVADNKEVTAVFFAVYYKDDGVDSARWYSQTPENGTASHTVSVSEFSSRAGDYCTYIYAFDASGNYAYVELNVITVPDETPPEPEFAVTVSMTGDAVKGGLIKWRAAASGGSGSYLYTFYLYRNGTPIQIRSASDYEDFQYTFSENGIYHVLVLAVDAKSGQKATVTSPDIGIFDPIVVSDITSDKEQNTAMLGESVFWTLHTSGGEGQLSYSYTIHRNGDVIYSSPFNTVKNNTVKIAEKPTDSGEYTVTVTIRDEESQVVSVQSEPLTVIRALSAANAMFSTGYAVVGAVVTCSAEVLGGSGSYTAVFRIFCDGELVLTSDEIASDEFTFTLPKGGDYTAEILVTDRDGARTQTAGGELTVDEKAKKGDANCDGKLTAADARYTLRCAVSLETPQANLAYACDVNEDGQITASDARLILRAVIGLEKL